MLPGKRRLTQRTAASQASPRRARADPATDDPDAAADLPPYLPQACSLTPEAVTALRSLYQNLGTTKIDEHIRDSLTYLGAGTAALNATLQSSRYQVDNMGEKKEAEKARLEKEVGKMEDITKGMTGDAEEAVRGIVDLRGELEDEKGVFESVVEVSTAKRREQEQRRAERQRQRQARAAENGDDEGANGAEEDEDMSDEEEPQAISDLVRDLTDRKAQNYAQMTMHQRYALNNDYADFKRQWHNGLHGEDAVLPDAKRWFSENNRPIFNFGRSTDEDEDGNIDGDTDLIVERATVSTRCPLSLRELEEPYSNKRCKHTFERTAIMEYIGRQGRVTCPQSGCHVVCTPAFSLARVLANNCADVYEERLLP